MREWWRGWLIAVVVSVAGCRAEAADDCEPGQAACGCINGTCAPGLECGLGNICQYPGGEDDGGSGSGGVDVDPACEAYLACLAKVAPGQIDEAEDAYGPSSPCWDSAQNADVCVMSCQSGLDAQKQAFPEEPACGGEAKPNPAYGPCQVDAHCETGVCRVTAEGNWCSVSCIDNTDCPSSPGGTAAKTCYSFCGLDCSLGTCPDGMTCTSKSECAWP